MDKPRLRSKLQKRLLAIKPRQRKQKSSDACQHLLSTPQFQDASTVMLFLSLPYEIDTSEAILGAWQLGKRVAVPKVFYQPGYMTAVQIDTLKTGFSTGKSGLRNPTAGVTVPFEQIDLVVTPGLGFDRKGNRLGRGSAYYDRFFANQQLKASRCGFAFAEQLLDSIPTKQHDEPMDFIVTDNGIIYVARPSWPCLHGLEARATWGKPHPTIPKSSVGTDPAKPEPDYHKGE